MVAIVHILPVLFIFSYSMVSSGLVTQNTPENTNSQNDWTFGITDIPSATVGWLRDQVYTPSQLEQESNSKDGSESNSINFVSHTNMDGSDKERTLPKLVIDFEESPDDSEPPKKVDDILKIIHDSSNEEKKQYVSFLESLEDTITNNPTRYVKVFLKDMWHVVDLGVFNSGERRRNAENVKTTLQIIKDLLYEILSSVFSFLTGRIEDGKKGAQRGWATYERAREGDHREWTEESALKKLSELDSQYKSMDKEAVVKDITSLCMQPLYKASTYEKMSEFLQKLKQDGFEKAPLEKDFNYVDYKLQFSKNHGIN